ncbi:aminoglycoside 3-N-acetyltransferase [Krasilnikoviella flava]|uniref:Aminoglycoside N(3)-acetyltransferase n=1 Tax=Krasilnikoviella flava TaxID=526729 RepID=A0A1T5JD71_9MICO|nr:aminoglycoside 3-N-acetyltransferase [Krasilnikoviella flava]
MGRGDVAVTADDVAAGLRQLGLGRTSTVLAHTSMRAFGHVDGGAAAVARALVEVCGTVVVPADTWDQTGVPAPPGLERPWNAYWNAATWAELDEAVDRAAVFAPDLPVDREMGAVPEALRRGHPHHRTAHPLKGFVATGERAAEIVGGQTLDRPLAPVEAVGDAGGDVLLVGVGHTANTAIHVAEQHLGRARYFRYAKVGPRAWAELADLPGESHRFDGLEPALWPSTREVRVGRARLRRVGVAEVLAVTRAAIAADPRALLCDDPGCRCAAAWRGAEPRPGA